MRLDDLYLVDVIEAAGRVARMMRGVNHDSFLGDELLASAVQYQLIIVGEACAKMQRASRGLDTRGVLGVGSYL